MPNLLTKVFRKFGTKTIRVYGAILRDPKKSPAEIKQFLDELLPAVEGRTLSNDEFDKKLEDFYGENPTLIFVGYVGRDRAGQLRLVDVQTGEWLGLPLAGDKIIPVQEFEQALKEGAIQRAC